MNFTEFIFYKILGWHIVGTFDSSLKKCVVIVAPHTSWQDFPIGAFVRRILKLNINFVGKKELFVWPFGYYFKWMGGAPIDRKSGQNKVEAIAKIFKEKEEFRLAMAPEGTRKKVKEWRTGYYYIAKAANVPIIAVSLDYSTRTVAIHQPYYLTENTQKDFETIHGFFKGVVGKRPTYS